MNYKLSSAVIGILCFSREPYYVPPSQSPFCPQVWSRVWCKCSHLLNPVPGALSSLLSSEQRAPSSLLSGLGPALRISFLMSSLPAPLGLGVLASSSLSLSGLGYQFSFVFCPKINTDYFMFNSGPRDSSMNLDQWLCLYRVTHMHTRQRDKQNHGQILVVASTS